MNKIKLIALDMDGTLLHDNGEVSNYTKQVIQRALQQDVKVVLSTGRPLPMCSSYAEQLQLTSYIITSNGAEVWTRENELLERHIMDPGLIEFLWELGNKHQFHMWYVAADNLFVDKNKPDNFFHYDWLKFGYGDLDESAKQFILSQLEDKRNIEITNSSPTNIEINKKGVNKASAIKSVCKQIGISMNEVMAVGDSLNDLKMIEQVGLGIAVANAQEVILDSADFVTDSNNDDGVAKAIERFVLA